MDNESASRIEWVTPELEQIDMVDTSTVAAGCNPASMGMVPGSKQMAGQENPSNGCSTGS